jgi:hypothetical protein
VRELIEYIQEKDIFKAASGAEVKKRQGGNVFRRFEFSLVIQGFGNTIDEAWEDAIQSFMDEPGAGEDCDSVIATPVDPFTYDEKGKGVQIV